MKQSEAMATQGYMTAMEAAEKAGVNIATVYRWVEAEKIDGLKAGKHWYVKVQSLIDHLGPELAKALGLVKPKAKVG